MEEVTKPRIQSFVLRQGRFTKGQQQAISDYYQDFVIPYNKAEKLDFKSLFANENDVVIEIGFGMGASLAQMAEENPHINYLGIEVHEPGVGSILNKIGKKNLKNIKLFHFDAFLVLNDMIADESISGIQVFFPDPWPKKRHHKRRLIQTNFCDLLAKKLKQGGFLHIATDWQDYADWCLEILNGHVDYANKDLNKGFVDKPESRPTTKFEQRGQRLGHGVWDLMYTKCN